MRKNNIVREGKIVTLNHLNGIIRVNNEVEKIIVKNTHGVNYPARQGMSDGA